MPGSSSNIARLAWACVAALTVLFVWIAVGTGASAGIAFFYAIPIGLATWWGGRRWGAIALAARIVAFVAVVLLVSAAKAADRARALRRGTGGDPGGAEAILEWADGPIRDDLCVLVLKPKRSVA